MLQRTVRNNGVVFAVAGAYGIRYTRAQQLTGAAFVYRPPDTFGSPFLLLFTVVLFAFESYRNAFPSVRAAREHLRICLL
jgi:hypothetical protein